MRLIDADALKKDLTRFYDNEVTAKRLIDEQPTIKPEQKKGKWEPVEVKGVPYGIIMKCNKCNFETMVNDALYYNYCPNCGVYVREDDHEIS